MGRRRSNIHLIKPLRNLIREFLSHKSHTISECIAHIMNLYSSVGSPVNHDHIKSEVRSLLRTYSEFYKIEKTPRHGYLWCLKKNVCFGYRLDKKTPLRTQAMVENSDQWHKENLKNEFEAIVENQECFDIDCRILLMKVLKGPVESIYHLNRKIGHYLSLCRLHEKIGEKKKLINTKIKKWI